MKKILSSLFMMLPFSLLLAGYACADVISVEQTAMPVESTFYAAGGIITVAAVAVVIVVIVLIVKQIRNMRKK